MQFLIINVTSRLGYIPALIFVWGLYIRDPGVVGFFERVQSAHAAECSNIADMR